MVTSEMVNSDADSLKREVSSLSFLVEKYIDSHLTRNSNDFSGTAVSADRKNLAPVRTYVDNRCGCQREPVKKSFTLPVPKNEFVPHPDLGDLLLQ